MAKTPRAWSPLDKTAFAKLAELRASHDFSLRALSERTGISKTRLTALFHFEMGSPTLNEVTRLCRTFGIRPSEFLHAIENEDDTPEKRTKEER